jgi:hypothetical protein
MQALRGLGEAEGFSHLDEITQLAKIEHSRILYK